MAGRGVLLLTLSYRAHDDDVDAGDAAEKGRDQDRIFSNRAHGRYPFGPN